MASRLNQLTSHLNYPSGLLANQVTIITGGGQGIGAECCRLFANEGAKVIVADIDSTRANSVADAINSAKPGRAIAVVGDILDEKYIAELVRKAAEFGNGKIHAIVNNAGFTWDGVVHKVYSFSPFFACMIYIYIYFFWFCGKANMVSIDDR